MKKILFCTLCLITLLTMPFMAGCNKDKVTGIEVTNYESVVLKGKELTGLKVNTIINDKTKGDIVDVNNDMITGYDKSKTGSQTVKITYGGFDFTFNVYVADKIITNATELRAALKAQKSGEVLALKSGTYNIDRDETTEYEGQTGYYFLLNVSNITIKGIGDVVIKSTVESPNGVWASQNFVTIVGDNTTIDNVTFMCKKEPNKVIEILGKNTTLKNIKVEPIDTVKFAGSIYLSTSAGNTTIENTTLKYGRITTSGASGSTLTLKNVTIDFAGAYLDDSTKESTFWGFDNSRSKITVTATNCKVLVSPEFKAMPEYATFTAQLPKGIVVEEKK